mgnify:CR=1 FL=1
MPPQAPLLLCFLHCNMSSLTVSKHPLRMQRMFGSMLCYVKKASQSFASADAKAVLYVFCRDMCVAENTLRGVSVELSAISGQQRRRTQRIFLEKVARPLFREPKKHPLPMQRMWGEVLYY